MGFVRACGSLVAVLFLLVAPAQADTSKIFAGTTSFVVPGNGSAVECIGIGGPGAQGVSNATASLGRPGGGGQGGSYAKLTTIANMPPGATLTVQVAAVGSGQATFLKDNTGTTVLQCPAGAAASSNTGGNATSGAIGDVTYYGGRGGNANGSPTSFSQAGAAGGGAAGPHGAGAQGGDQTVADTAGGSGGGGADGGTGGASGTAGNAGGQGGQNRLGGPGAGSNTTATNPGAGSGGGSNGQAGRTGPVESVPAWGAGYGPAPGASGPGGGQHGKDCGASDFGCGGSGGGIDRGPTFEGLGGQGGPAIIVFTYTPAASPNSSLMMMGVGMAANGNGQARRAANDNAPTSALSIWSVGQ